MLLNFVAVGLGQHGFDEGLDNGGVKVQPCFVLQLHNGFRVGLLPVAGAGINIAVVIIGHSHNAGTNGNILSLQAFGITGAIPFFVVAADNIRNIGKFRDIFQHAGPGDAVALINGHFPGGQEGQLDQNQIGHGKLADVVEQGSRFDLGYFAGRQAQFGSGAGGIISHLLTVQIDFPIFNLQHFEIEITDFLGQAEIREIETLGYGNHSLFPLRVW